jgi:hypothetical protein
MSIEATLEHKRIVNHLIGSVIKELVDRADNHDLSKLEKVENDLFEVMTPKLASATFNSPEYKAFLEELKPALDHHYARNRHHPEHWENGIQDMDLIDLLELICDWKASSLRQNNGNLLTSIDSNQERFGFSKELARIFKNTAKFFND